MVSPDGRKRRFEMKRRDKVTTLVCVAIIIFHVIFICFLIERLSNETEVEIPTNRRVSDGTENITQVEVPEFHLFDVSIENPTISWQAQNLGNVSATDVVFAFEIKLGGEHVVLYREEEIIPFVWYTGNITISVIESKRVDAYSTEIPIDFWIEQNITGMRDPKNLEILASNWNITCAEGVEESFSW